ncbi:D-alanyl-D-alanine carboxypeptidase/D-alanyl-D-alanine endopeptidase [Macromonas nakdongensis]|uniref:D-alanyl-D-alanine carboxypeptidase/D-alanyl-D-alanine endopeptidase n=1 Tax=Macromonas nakdongensis TaxID=1843082 RepID=UPI001E497BB7|nr:D-alanyl-D-alanine carboxypeptidase/D-alanyl-D-alanine-endopeptidase [Macromonas nakdongensis]
MPHAGAATLPEPVRAALQGAGLPTDALVAVVADAAPDGSVWLAHQDRRPVNPASVMKLVTTYAALDLLGPAHVWRTTVHTDAPVRDGVLQGHLYLRGGGDPQLVTEKLWWLLRRVQGLGIQRVAGDIVLDRSAFDVPAVDPAAFDGEPLRPYNATPDAWLVNYKAQQFHFVPDAAAGVARVALEPPLAGVAVPATVPLDAGPCGDWRTGLRAQFTDPLRPRFDGRYPLACGERAWPLAHPEPERFAERAVAGVWTSLGGQLDGRVRPGEVPPQATLRLTLDSPPLAQVVRDVNKFSNNVMAQHVLLALGQSLGGATTFEGSRQVLAQWWTQRLGPEHPAPVVDNGAGLSRGARLTAAGLARLLQLAYASPMMPELMASLPASGLDGTLRRSPMGVGLAHLKTGSLRDVQALAGYVHGPGGQRRVLVAIVNHPDARAARPALDALVQWAAGR